MVSYSPDGKTATIDGLKFTRDERTGYYLAARPTFEGKRERLHVYVYRTRRGEIPDGYQVHHKDEDKTNNEPGNLALLSGHEHLSWHGQHISEERREEMRRNLIENAIPKAAEWHRSPEGRAWHSRHAREIEYKTHDYVCDQCGINFTGGGRKTGNHFCSNNCKSAYRRMMGFDNIEKRCDRCGASFVANKYSGRRYCCEGCRREAARGRARVQHDG